ncbi:MAG TPA: FHA domain-containing protein [Gemmatimonadaceae bacterium]|nr:FHA domain-containing protein [Gemmatimonadaceae bacterium]
MAYFQLGDRQFALKAGSQRVGPAGTGADVVLPSGPPNATAVVTVNADQSVVIMKAAADSEVMVNKVPLGAEPSPLMHGDHVELGGHDLRFGDTKQQGSTQMLSADQLAQAIKARASTPGKPTTATGGRLVSQLDGREYEVPNRGLVIGRDPSAEIVVAANEVSRRHVQIAPAGQGYVLTDLSTNGVWVNGERVAKEQTLARGDVVRVGNEEFRFYADVAKPAPAAASPVATPPSPAAFAAPPTPLPPTRLPEPVTAAPASPPLVPPAPAAPAPLAAPVAAGTPVIPPPPSTPAPPSAPASSRPALATLEVLNEGPDKGRRVDVHSALTNIGRGPHNDLVISNESVSDSHAKLQKRENGWYIVDVNSTNGVYVGGHRVYGEQLLAGAPDLRFGDVKVAFRPSAAPVDSGKSTRAISLDELKKATAAKPQAPPARPAPVAAPPEPELVPLAAKKSTPAWFWGVLILIGAAVIGYLTLKGG